MNKEELGKRIKLARTLYTQKTGHKMTQQALAKMTGISRGYVGDLEKGRTAPSLETLKRIASACDVGIDFFTSESLDQIPSEIKDLGIEYMAVTLELKKRGLSPEEIRKLADVAEMFRKSTK